MKCKGCAFVFEFWIRPSQCFAWWYLKKRDHNWQIFLKVIFQPDKSYFNQMNIHCFILYVLLCVVVFISLVYIILSAFAGARALKDGAEENALFVDGLAGIGCEMFNQATFDYRHMPVSLNIRYPKTPWVCHVLLGQKLLTLRQIHIISYPWPKHPFVMLKPPFFLVTPLVFILSNIIFHGALFMIKL